MQYDGDNHGEREHHPSPVHAAHVDPADIAGDINHGALYQFITDTYKTVEIDGREIIQTPDGQFMEHVLMEQDYFVENWLSQFALATVGGKCYFDYSGWGEMTAQFTKGVIVVDQEGDVIAVIDKFAQANLPEDAKGVLDRVAREAGVANLVPDENEKSRIINTLAAQTKFIGDTADQKVAVTLTDMVPAHVYKRFGVNPLVMQQVIFIRDRFGAKEEDMERIEQVLTKWNEEHVASKQDREFIATVSKGNFIFDESGHLVDEVVGKEEADEEPFNPFTS